MENVLFKQSLRGFDRQQVLAYIDEMTAKMNTQAEEYTRQQEKLESEIEDLSKKLDEGSSILKLSQENTDKLNGEIEYLKQNNAELKRQVALYRNMILERDREITGLKTDFTRLSEKTLQLEQDNLRWKAKQDEIAACMVEASVRAKQIIEDAEAEARLRKQQMRQNASDLMGKVVDMKAEIAALEEQLNSSFSKLSAAMQKMDKAGSLIESQVKEYREKVEKVDTFVPVQEEKAKPVVHTKVVSQPKKSLTDSVLDTISKLLEK